MGSVFSMAQSKYSEIYNSTEFINQGVKLFENEKYEESIFQYDKVARPDMDYLKAQYEKAYSLFMLKKYEELEAMLEKFRVSGEIKEMPGLYIVYGNLLSTLERYDESEKIYLEGKKIIPMSNGLLFNTAIMYLRSEQKQKGVDTLMELIELNPNNVSAHYLLGSVAFEEGKVVEASLALLGYLMIDPTGQYASDAIIKLNTKFGGVSKNTGTVKFSAVGDDFSELEMILKNELALSPKYKVNSSIDDIYTRQVQAIMEYLPEHQSKGGFFDQYYVPWLTDISRKNYTEHFTYYTLIALEEQLGKPYTSQKKKIETFMDDYVAKYFWETFAKRKRMHFGKQEEVTIYLKEGLPYSQGKTVNGKSEGKYLFMNEYGQTLSELNYLSDELDGLQHYYYPNLQKSEEVTYVKGHKNGPFKDYYWNGSIRLEGGFQNDLNHGAYKSYYPNGGVLCEFTFTNGTQNGKNICYWPNGSKLSEYNYVNDKIEGPAFVYNEAGDITSELNFKNGLYDGKILTYYDGKQIKTTSEYLNGEVSNNYKEYSGTNQLINESIFQNGKLTNYKSYDLLGHLQSQSFFNDKGETTESRYYSNKEKIYLTEFYKNDEIQKILLHYPDPEKPKEVSLKNTFLEVKDSEGTLLAKGNYKDGKLDGEWIYYYENGEISSKKNYSKGQLNGLYTDYKKGNILNYTDHLKEGGSDGLYESFAHDKLYFSLYSKDGNNNGPFKYYYPNGKISSEGFFVNRERNYNYYEYTIDGNIKIKKTYVDNQIVQETRYDQKGNVESEFNFANKTGVFEIKNPKNQILTRYELKNGVRNGLTTVFQLDGTKNSEFQFLNDVRHGPYKFFYPNGILSSEGVYYSGVAHGQFNYYDQFGNIRIKTQYVYDKENGDVIQYFPNGKVYVTYQTLNDLEHGEKKFFNYDGKAIASIQYELGTPVSYKVLNAQRELGDSQIIKGGNAQIESKYPNGKTAFTINFEKGLREGKSEAFEENGQPISSNNYKKDKLQGERLQYHETGKIFKREFFDSGEFNGLVEIFDPAGNPHISIKYYYDIIHGEVKLYKNGKLDQTKIYDSGNLVEVL